jgi:hypothetical protein
MLTLFFLKVVSCEFISRKYSMQEQEYAYHAMESVANYHNMAWQVKQASVNNYNNVEGDIMKLMDTFSDGKAVDKHHGDYQRDVKLAYHITTGIMLLAGVATGGAFMSAALAIESLENVVVVADIVGALSTSEVLGSNIHTDLLKTS